jgi:fructokinase
MSDHAGTIAVIGEALIDVVETGDDEPRLARPGGSPYNVALGLARLEAPVRFVGRLSGDPLGAILRRHAERSAVDLTLCVEALEPTTVALVELDDAGAAQYRFGVDGTADFRWTSAELARVPEDVAAVHFGSLASWLSPGDAVIAGRVAELRAAGAIITYDPNVRPHLQPDGAAARAQVEAVLPIVDLVKTSEEDLAHLHPGRPVEPVARAWLAAGPAAVVVTLGGAGSLVVTAGGTRRVPPRPVKVVDTVGAGDAFMSGLLDALHRRGWLRRDALGDVGWDDVLDDAGLVAALTCARAGANPPWRAEVEAARG